MVESWHCDPPILVVGRAVLPFSSGVIQRACASCGTFSEMRGTLRAGSPSSGYASRSTTKRSPSKPYQTGETPACASFKTVWSGGCGRIWPMSSLKKSTGLWRLRQGTNTSTPTAAVSWLKFRPASIPTACIRNANQPPRDNRRPNGKRYKIVKALATRTSLGVHSPRNCGFKRVVAGNAFPNVPDPVFIDEFRIVGSNKRLAAFAAFDDGSAACRRMHGRYPCVYGSNPKSVRAYPPAIMLTGPGRSKVSK